MTDVDVNDDTDDDMMNVDENENMEDEYMTNNKRDGKYGKNL